MSIVLPPYNFPVSPIPNITPFTYRDGLTYLERMEAFITWVNDVVVVFVNDNYSELADTFETEVTTLINTVNQALADQTANNNTALNDQLTAVNTALTNLQISVNSQIGDLEGQTVEEGLDAVVAYVDSAVASIIGSTISVTDPVTLAILQDTDSDTYAELLNIIGTNIRTPGTDSNKATLEVLADASGLQYADDFSRAEDGALDTLVTGQEYRVWPASGPRTPRVVDGQLTFDATATAGGYASVDNDEQRFNHIEAFITFTAYTATGGLGCLAFMESNIGDSFDDGDGVPRSPGHLYIAPDGWSFGVFRSLGGELDVLASGSYSTPLTADGETAHHASITLDTDAGVAYVSIPASDGGQRLLRFKDDAFRDIPAHSAFIEPFKTSSSTTHTLAGFTAWGASSASRHEVAVARDRKSLDAFPVARNYEPDEPVAVSFESIDAIDALNVRAVGRFGPTGAAHIHLNACWSLNESADLYVGLRPSSGGAVINNTATRVRAPGAAVDQIFSVTIPVFGTPFAEYDYLICHGVYGTDAEAILQANSNQRIVWTCIPA